MIDVCELTKFMPSEKTLRLVMDIAAALERYRIDMEGSSGFVFVSSITSALSVERRR